MNWKLKQIDWPWKPTGNSKLDLREERVSLYSQRNRNKLAFSIEIRITYTIKMHKATLWTKCSLKCDIAFPLTVK